mmetsp:Transcript_12231/g.38868  ORF Transcript_12231/g.38868 Transcript_12231/m.38868 type:complete len:269 (-) Transcript_12231:236-1042(-)
MLRPRAIARAHRLSPSEPPCLRPVPAPPYLAEPQRLVQAASPREDAALVVARLWGDALRQQRGDVAAPPAAPHAAREVDVLEKELHRAHVRADRLLACCAKVERVAADGRAGRVDVDERDVRHVRWPRRPAAPALAVWLEGCVEDDARVHPADRGQVGEPHARDGAAACAARLQVRHPPRVDKTDPLDEHVVDAAAQLRPNGDACMELTTGVSEAGMNPRQSAPRDAGPARGPLHARLRNVIFAAGRPSAAPKQSQPLLIETQSSPPS